MCGGADNSNKSDIEVSDDQLYSWTNDTRADGCPAAVFFATFVHKYALSDNIICLYIEAPSPPD